MERGRITMSNFPIFMDLRDKNILIVGGGDVAYRKWRTLSEFDATVTVVALSVSEGIKKETLNWMEKSFEPADLDGKDLAVIATNDRMKNQEIAALCKNRHIFINVADDSAQSDFTFPSYIRKKDIVIGVSTSGKSPVIARYIKDKIEALISDELVAMTEWMGEVKSKLKHSTLDMKTKKSIYNYFMELFDKTKKVPSKEEKDKYIQKLLEKQKNK